MLAPSVRVSMTELAPRSFSADSLLDTTYRDTDDRIRWIAEQLGMRTVMYVPPSRTSPAPNRELIFLLTPPSLPRPPSYSLISFLNSWSDDTDDWNWVNVGKAAIEANYNDIIATAPKRPQGAIVLSHEINAGTMELSQEFLPQIQKTFTGGVMPVSFPLLLRPKLFADVSRSQVAVCMNNTEPYVEQGGQYVYPDYNQWMAGTTTVSLLAPTALSTSQSLTLTAASSARKPTTTPEASSPTTKAPSTSASVSSSYSSVGSSSLAQSSRSSSAPSAASDAQAASQSTGAPSSGSEKTTVSVGAAVLGLMGIILV